MDEELDVASVIIPQEVLLTDGTAHSYLQKHSKQLQYLPIHHYPVEKTSNHMLYPSIQENYLGIEGNSNLFRIIKDSVSKKSYDFVVKYGNIMECRRPIL